MKSIFILPFFISIALFGQSESHEIYKIKEIDSSLVGRNVKFAVDELGIDTNWRAIFEPPGIGRGIITQNFDNCEIQIYVECGAVSLGKRPKAGSDYRPSFWKQIKSKEIIGISWKIGESCGHVGEVINHYSYNKFGPCD